MSLPRGLPIVNLTTDSEDSEEDVPNSFIVSSNTIPASLNLKETTPKSTCSCKCNHTAAQVDPLFRVIFKDEQTARKYRLRIEDILKYVLTSKINDENSESSLTDLVLEVYDPAAIPAVNTHSPRVKKKIQTELPSSNNYVQNQKPTSYVDPTVKIDSNSIKNQQPTSYVDPTVNIDKRIKQEKIVENEKKRKSSAQIPETLASNNHDPLDNAPQLQKKIKVEPTVENESNIQPAEPSLKPADQNGTAGRTTIDNKGSSALTVIYQKILEHEYPQENKNLETCFENSFVQIGSYGYFHEDKSIFLSKDGLTSFVPTLKRGKRLVIVSIEIDDITKVFTCFSETKPSLFLYVTKKAADGIRDLLSMDNPNGPYIDAGSMNPIHHRIAISPLKISKESKQIIMQLFKNTQLIEINEVHAESLLATYNTSTEELLPHQTSTCGSDFANDSIKESKSCNDSSLHITTHQKAIHSTNRNFRTVFFSRVLRVGSFEYCKRRVFSMDAWGIKFCVPHLVNVSSIITVNINIEKIVKLRICFSEACPVIFIYVCAEAAGRIRTAIGMNDSSGSYFDPDSGDETCNKIIILPQQLSENCKIIKELFKTGLIEKLDEEVANNILTHSFSKTKRPAVPTESNDSSNKNLRVSFQSNCLRIGTYKCVQLDINVEISSNGLKINVPKVGSSVFKSIIIPFNEITKVYYCFKKVFALFFCTSVSCAQTIRYIIDMPENNKGNVYFNPNSASIAEQRLVIIFNKLKYVHLSILKNLLLNHTLSEEVTSKVAGKMLSNKL